MVDKIKAIPVKIKGTKFCFYMNLMVYKVLRKVAKDRKMTVEELVCLLYFPGWCELEVK